MNPQQARDVLVRHHPSRPVESDDVELVAALQCAQVDPDLQEWLCQHNAFQEEVRRRLRAVPAAQDLRRRLLACRSADFTSHPNAPAPTRLAPWMGRREWFAAAAAVVGLVSVTAWWTHTPRGDGFADFRTRMVQTVLREYRMDIRSGNMGEVRSFMAGRGAPHDYLVPGGLGQRQLAGGGFLRWRNRPVAMVCFAEPDGQMSYLFVLDRVGLRDVPSDLPQHALVHGRSCAAWSSGDHVYLLTSASGKDVRALM